MGTGKTAMGGTAAIAIAAGVVKSMQDAMRPDQVVLIVAPPHLVEKWKRELHSIHSNIFVERLDRHEDVKAFMDKAARLGPGIAKIGLIKRDMTKLGSGHEPAVIWRNEAVALWQHGSADAGRLRTASAHPAGARAQVSALRLHRHAGEEGDALPGIRKLAQKRQTKLLGLPGSRCGRKPATTVRQPKPGTKYPVEEPALPP